MTNTPFFADAVIIAAVNAAALTLNSGFLDIRSGTIPTDANTALTGTLLAHLPLSATAFVSPAVASGSAGSRLVTATANAITTASSAAATGTASYFALMKSDNVTVLALGSCGTSGCDLNLNSTAISAGAAVSCSAFTITMSEQ